MELTIDDLKTIKPKYIIKRARRRRPPSSTATTNNATTTSSYTSTMEMLKKRITDIQNIFHHYAQCDASIPNNEGYYWREQDFTRFLREFRFLGLFGRRPCVELYQNHSTKHHNKWRLYSTDNFIWLMSSFANALPWSAGSTPEQRTTLLLHSLDEGLHKIASTRSPVYTCSSPKHKWLSKSTKVNLSHSGRIISSLAMEQSNFNK